MINWGGLSLLIKQLLYPKGCLFINDSADFNTVEKVKAWMGFGEWEEVPEGTFIEATRLSSLTTSNNKHNPGIPNVTGKGNTYQFNDVDINTGCLSYKNEGSDGWGSGVGKTWSKITIDASKGEVHNGVYRNDVYGKSDTVQPKSQLYYIYHRKS